MALKISAHLSNGALTTLPASLLFPTHLTVLELWSLEPLHILFSLPGHLPILFTGLMTDFPDLSLTITFKRNLPSSYSLRYILLYMLPYTLYFFFFFSFFFTFSFYEGKSVNYNTCVIIYLMFISLTDSKLLKDGNSDCPFSVNPLVPPEPSTG